MWHSRRVSSWTREVLLEESLSVERRCRLFARLMAWKHTGLPPHAAARLEAVRSRGRGLRSVRRLLAGALCDRALGLLAIGEPDVEHGMLDRVEARALRKH